MGVVATAGILSIALVAPNAMQILKIFDKNKKYYSQKKYYFNKVIQRLEAKKLINIQKNNKGQKLVKITNKGKLFLDKNSRKKLDKPGKWDGKYRIIIFDIKETRKLTRDKIRNQLKVWGFRKLQASVWVYPYPCGQLVTLLKSDLAIGKDLLYLVVDSMEGDYKIRRSFNLPN